MTQPTRSDLAPSKDHAQPERDPVSPFCHDVLDVFRGPLADVRFPDVDRADLEAREAATVSVQLEVEALERALEQARARTLEAQGALTERALRALAYARVFASGQPELEDALSAVRAPASRGAVSPREGARAPAERSHDAASPPGLEVPRRRGRPRKEPAAGALLPMSDPMSEGAHEPALAAE